LGENRKPPAERPGAFYLASGKEEREEEKIADRNLLIWLEIDQV
jgi:hypothetical protein